MLDDKDLEFDFSLDLFSCKIFSTFRFLYACLFLLLQVIYFRDLFGCFEIFITCFFFDFFSYDFNHLHSFLCRKWCEAQLHLYVTHVFVREVQLRFC